MTFFGSTIYESMYYSLWASASELFRAPGSESHKPLGNRNGQTTFPQQRSFSASDAQCQLHTDPLQRGTHLNLVLSIQSQNGG